MPNEHPRKRARAGTSMRDAREGLATLVMTCSAVVLALQCSTVMLVLRRFAPLPPPPTAFPRTPARDAPSDEKAYRIIMSLPQPSGPTRMKGSLFSIHGSIMLSARWGGATRGRNYERKKRLSESQLLTHGRNARSKGGKLIASQGCNTPRLGRVYQGRA